MKFSIVTSFYNEPEELINECCESVLSQTYSNFEWVITDDFSQNENTTKLVKSLPKRDKRIRYVEQTKKKEVWWNPQTYTKGDVVVTVDGDDHMFPKVLEVYNYFYNKYPDVICMTTEIRNYKNRSYSGSIYLNYENYRNHLDFSLDVKHDPNLEHGINVMFRHGYNRSWRNINGLDFKGDLDDRLIIVDFLQLTKLEEYGKILHIPRALYGYNTREISISRTTDLYNDKNFRTQEIDQSIVDRRKGKEINSIKRIFDGIFIESNAFFNCGISTDSTAKKLTFIKPGILSLKKQEQIKELYFDHDIYFNDYRDDIDYCLIQLDAPEQYGSFLEIYENIKKYIGVKNVMIQITYKKIDMDENDLFLKITDFIRDKHCFEWFDFDNHYQSIKFEKITPCEISIETPKIEEIKENNKYYSQFGEDKFLYEKFLNYSNGFFIEIGAMNGIIFSNTKFFEDELNWNGILIEPVPYQYNELIINRPNCYNFNCVVSETNGDVDFIGSGAVGGLASTMSDVHKSKFGLYPENGHPPTKIKSLPFYEITKNIDIKRVDFFSIDVEGGEFEVLNTFDWNIPVYLILIEMDGNNPEKDDKCRKLLIEKGFEFIQKLGVFENRDLNEIWINKNNKL